MSRERKLIESHLLIENKQQKVVPFRYNAIQARYDEQKTNRDIILKGRQFGFSSVIGAEALMACLTKDNTRAVVISHEKDATQRLFARVKKYVERFYIRDANGEPQWYKVPVSYNNRNELHFPETNSTFYIGTAGAKAVGRGDTIHFLHLSEVAFYDRMDELLAGLIPAVTKEGRIILETTANGFNSFRDWWEASKIGKTSFKQHFFSWLEHKEYSERVIDKGIIEGKLDDEEISLVERFNASPEQLQWRRLKLLEYKGDMDRFHQEFPVDDFEAFISSGRPVFNQNILKLYLNTCRAPYERGFVSEIGQYSQGDEGYIRIYEWPEEDVDYVIGADVAEGLEHGDYSVGMVMSRDFRLVATWHGHIDPDLFARELVGLARFYNGAVIGVERNNHGILVNQKIKDMGYEGLYRRQYLDKVRKAPAHQLGWQTDTKTKAMIIGELREAIREEAIEIYEEETIKELLSYQVDTNGHTNAQEGQHDDRVMALAIALKMVALTSPMEYSGGRIYQPRSVAVIKQELRRLKSHGKNYVVTK